MFDARRELKHRVDALSRIPFLESCTPRQLARIDRLGTPVGVRPGRTLTREGALGRECFVVFAGLAVAERDGQPVGEIGGGSIAGEMALLDHTMRNATVVARTSMRLLVLSDREFETLLEIAPRIETDLGLIADARRDFNRLCILMPHDDRAADPAYSIEPLDEAVSLYGPDSRAPRVVGAFAVDRPRCTTR